MQYHVCAGARNHCCAYTDTYSDSYVYTDANANAYSHKYLDRDANRHANNNQYADDYEHSYDYTYTHEYLYTGHANSDEYFYTGASLPLDFAFNHLRFVAYRKGPTTAYVQRQISNKDARWPEVC